MSNIFHPNIKNKSAFKSTVNLSWSFFICDLSALLIAIYNLHMKRPKHNLRNIHKSKPRTHDRSSSTTALIGATDSYTEDITGRTRTFGFER